jgi:hypothetical protein
MRRLLHRRSAITSFLGATLAAFTFAATARTASAQAVIDVTASFGDLNTRLLSQAANGAATFRVVNSDTNAVESTVSYGPYGGWTIKALAPSAGNRSRLLWSHEDGRASIWTLSPTGTFEDGFEVSASLDIELGPTSRVVDLAGDTRGGYCYVFVNQAGRALVGAFNPVTNQAVARFFGPFPGWRPIAVTAGPNEGAPYRLLWRNVNGTASVWRLGVFGAFIDGKEHGPFPGWNPIDVSVGGDDNSRLLWANTNGATSVWVVSPEGAFLAGREYSAFPGWTPRAISTGLDSQSRLLWNNADTRASLWYLDHLGQFLRGFEYTP